MTNGGEPISPVLFGADGASVEIEFEGLTKREYFAAMAMQGLLAAGDRDKRAHNAVRNADYLIEALNGIEPRRVVSLDLLERLVDDARSNSNTPTELEGRVFEIIETILDNGSK